MVPGSSVIAFLSLCSQQCPWCLEVYKALLRYACCQRHKAEVSRPLLLFLIISCIYGERWGHEPKLSLSPSYRGLPCVSSWDLWYYSVHFQDQHLRDGPPNHTFWQWVLPWTLRPHSGWKHPGLLPQTLERGFSGLWSKSPQKQKHCSAFSWKTTSINVILSNVKISVEWESDGNMWLTEKKMYSFDLFRKLWWSTTNPQ